MSRAFVSEHNEELTSFRDDEEHTKKLTDWLKIQEKKLNFMLNDPKGRAIEPEKRNRWIREAEMAIQNARSDLGLL